MLYISFKQSNIHAIAIRRIVHKKNHKLCSNEFRIGTYDYDFFLWTILLIAIAWILLCLKEIYNIGTH